MSKKAKPKDSESEVIGRLNILIALQAMSTSCLAKTPQIKRVIATLHSLGASNATIASIIGRVPRVGGNSGLARPSRSLIPIGCYAASR